jgi:hypothetical protein
VHYLHERSNATVLSSGPNRRQILSFGLGAASLVAPIPAFAQTYILPQPKPFPLGPQHGPISRRDGIDSILFWNEVCLDLVSLDHSIDAKDARAPGPCASARALGLAHIVMADAAAAVYPSGYEGLYVRGVQIPNVEFPGVFVGAAAAWMLEQIYSTPIHTHFIGLQRMRFLKQQGQHVLNAWNTGLAFARNQAFTSRWDWPSIKYAALDSSSRASFAGRGEHDVDPYNTDQKFYGVNWGRVVPLTPGLSIGALGPPDPPSELNRVYLEDLEEVRALGAFRAYGATVEQVQLGLFWAYDGPRLIGTPPRLYNQFARQIAEADGMSAPELARTLALCNLAMADAAIVCWEAKYRYRVWRPVIGIARARYNPDPTWRPYGSPRTNPVLFSLGRDSNYALPAQSLLGGGQYVMQQRETTQNALPYQRAAFTPNFPAYPSGHSTFGSACFNMLKLTRAERAPTAGDPGRIDNPQPFISDEVNGVSIDNFTNAPRPYWPLQYSRLEKMIQDNNKSRVHLGVHWNFDCDQGDVSGAKVAAAVYRSAYRRFR